MRVKRGVARRAKHNKILKQAKGFRGRRKSVFKLAKQAVYKAGKYAYRDRRNKKREMRALWIIRINAAARANGMSYSDMIKKLSEKNIEINRKLLAEIAATEPKVFEKIVSEIKK